MDIGSRNKDKMIDASAEHCVGDDIFAFVVSPSESTRMVLHTPFIQKNCHMKWQPY